jgi:hypothetical protein
VPHGHGVAVGRARGSALPAGSVEAVEPELATDAAPVSCPVALVPSLPTHTSPADLAMRRLLRLPLDAPKASEASARSLVERSLLISMVRCLLTYVVLPFVAPAVGAGVGVTPVVGIAVGTVAIVANVASVRRFWRADHRYRWHYTALASVIVVLLMWLIVADVLELLS